MKAEVIEDFIHPLSPIQKMNETKERPPLYNQPPPTVRENKREQPQHRVMLELAAKGYTNGEISKMTGFTPNWVANTLRQPYVQQILVNEIQRVQGEDEEVVQVIKENVVASCRLLETILDGGRPADSIEDRKLQMEAAERFLNRRYGKPNQPVNRNTGPDLNTLSIAEIAAQLPKTEGTK